MENDGFSDKSERELQDDWDATAEENGGRLTEESDMEQSEETPPPPPSTAYEEQSTEDIAEVPVPPSQPGRALPRQRLSSICPFAPSGRGGVPGGDGV